MRKITSSLFTSLDGVVDADGDWQYPYFDDELFAVVSAAWDAADAAVMGRRSFGGYDALRTHHPDSPMLGFLHRVERYVVSSSTPQMGWPGTTVLRDDAFERLAGMREGDGANVLVAGSPTLVRGLFRRGLLDELSVLVLPVVVGSGARLIPDDEGAGSPRVPLSLTSSTTLRSGAVHLRYAPENGSPA